MDGVEQNHGPEDEDEDDGAERAFAALREEVAAQRRTLERMAAVLAGQGPGAAAPDYSPTLGVIAQELRAVGARLDGMEAHPALRLTPAAYAQQATTGINQVRDEAGLSLTHAQGRLSDALHELRSLIGSARSQFAQQRREWVAVAIGAGLGVAVWYPLIWLIPWGGGDRLAATLIGGGRWGAGATLMQEADPASWDRMVRLYRACPRDSMTELCEAAVAVRTIPPGQEGARSSSRAIAPSQPPSRR